MTEPPCVKQEIHPPVLACISFGGTTSPSVVRTSLKRSITSDLDFLSPAADSFKPRPYSPARASCSTNTRGRYSQSTRTQTRTSIASPPLALDVSEKDTDVVFIHPPFTDFPDATAHRDGLSFMLMAEHPDWFLDPKDYLPLEGPIASQNAIPYPNFLEPPRGWCPAKKKEIKDKGAEWAEGEEPKLRCTFCRRSYAGVNAKSMWRRHVFEKHKVAMSNRREGSERPRGRGSMSKFMKNRRPTKIREEHDSLLGIEVAPQMTVGNTIHKSRFQGVMAPSRNNDSCGYGLESPSIPQPELSSGSDRSISPPSTPPPILSEAEYISSSPYDPTLTPAFRHSSPKLPSDQPWRFPSPAHPLYSRQRQVSLSQLVLVPGTKSFVATDSPDRVQPSVKLESSPLKSMILPSSSPILTPTTSPQHRRTCDSDAFINESDDNEVPDKWGSFGSVAPTSSPFRLVYEESTAPLALTGDSPILRNKTLPTGVGFLLEPISLVNKKITTRRPFRDEEDEAEIRRKLSHFPPLSDSLL
ncbi:hypothetical protein BDZ89DRAFT_1058908 [Hymenopellis radicata]|nr:hypothetical protein BDZ89DRAFT_1058908 [Hymenopellis radicata]